MVFQNYALYPHMTVYDNLAFGLQLRHVPQAEIHKKVLWAAKVLKLEEYLERKPKALSGGQRQRVSLGRAILRTPKVFLLDEPLSNLDAKLRTEMRAEISKIHQEVQTTFIYVTHDQVEAMTMGTRIVVMSMGYVQQIDTPQNLYNYPVNKFVAGFIGTPQMNFFDATLNRKGNNVEIKLDGVSGSSLNIPFEKMLKVRPEYLNGDRKVTIGLRCEHISADPEVVAKSDNVLPIRISHFEELGNETLIYGDLDHNIKGLGDSKTALIVKQYGGDHASRIGDIIDVAFDISRAHFFDAEKEHTICPRVPSENVFDVALNGDVVKLLGQEVKLPRAILKQLQGKETSAIKTMLIPTRALTAGGSDLSGKVVKTEKIGKDIITHITTDNRTFFLVGDKEYALDEVIGLDIDFKQVAFAGSDQEEVVLPLQKYDTFYGSYFDRSNAKRSVSYLVSYYNNVMRKEILALNKERNAEVSKVIVEKSQLKAIKEDYARAKKEILGNMSYRLGTESLGKEGQKRVKAEAEEQIAAARNEMALRSAEYYRRKTEFDTLAAGEREGRLDREREIRTEYAAKQAVIEAKYNSLIAKATGNVESACAVLAPIEAAQQAAADEELSRVNVKYADLIAVRTSELQSAVDEAKARVATAVGVDRDAAIIALKDAERAQGDRMKELQAARIAEIDEVAFNSKVFTTYINGFPYVTNLDINKKIVKGLGAQLFISNYRFEVPHDAYSPTDNGIEVEVIDTLDYGKEKYLLCRLDDGIVYVKAAKEYKAGDRLQLSIDITKSRIFENKFDIRLY
jgi:multiple sugar transport system ATP-binding protein